MAIHGRAESTGTRTHGVLSLHTLRRREIRRGLLLFTRLERQLQSTSIQIKIDKTLIFAPQATHVTSPDAERPVGAPPPVGASMDKIRMFPTGTTLATSAYGIAGCYMSSARTPGAGGFILAERCR